MRIHLLGISGTFMSGLAMIAKQSGHEVSGCDAACYPPISDLLNAHGIRWTEGYDVNEDYLKADVVIVGNAMKRGYPIVEAMLNQRRPYISGPQWLYETVLHSRRVISVSGTHGKTTTTCMIASMLDEAGLNPGFLIGGMAPAFGTNARLGEGEWFVIEADEYDTAFFDKRPKFIHYHPSIAVLNNLEYDHADIYPNLASIEQQFQYLIRTIPSEGVILKPQQDEALNRVIQKGCYSDLESMQVVGPDADEPDESVIWHARMHDPSGSSFTIFHQHQALGTVHWSCVGAFNVENALSAFAASHHAGVPPQRAIEALNQFQPVKRRLELRAQVKGVDIYDDFAHHPTAIQRTIEAIKRLPRYRRILVALEFASYTMKTGVHIHRMAEALHLADQVFILQTDDTPSSIETPTAAMIFCPSTTNMIDRITAQAQTGDAIVFMSNRGFDNIHQRLADALNIHP